MYIARTIVLFACIIALASAGAVRSSTKPQNNNDVVEMDKENVATLTSNLVKAATDKSSPNLSRKANETVEAMFSKMKSEENVERSHEKEMTVMVLLVVQLLVQAVLALAILV